jgi:thiazolinyl imide reductase
MKRVRVLVCGTNYGLIYREAIQQAPRVFELAGILTRGSARSREAAKESGVPLYQRVESLPGDIDIACAAMGTSGEEAVLGLLKRGIHVLCEHPHKADFLDMAMRTAADHAACFHLNGHFAGLKAASAFIQYANLARRFGAPLLLDAMVTDRSLYGALDILRRVTNTLQPCEFSVRDHSSPLVTVKGALGGIPITFHIQRSGTEGHLVLKDGDPRYIVDHRLAAVFLQGVLTMLSMAGPVIWNFNIYRSLALNRPLWTRIYTKSVSSFDLYRQRVRANLLAVRCLVKSAREHVVPEEQTRGHIMDVSLAWNRITTLVCDVP